MTHRRTATSGAAALAVLHTHCAARDYHACIDAIPRLALPPRLRNDTDLLQLAALAISETFGLLDARQAPAVRATLHQALAGGADAALARAAPDTVLAWCTAAAEWCEREGLDQAFTRLQPRAAAADATAAAGWRVYWRTAAAWHHESFGRVREVARLLHEAQAIAQSQADPALCTTVALRLARLALARSDGAGALAQAERALQRSSEVDAPLWHADAADVASRVALTRGDFHEALFRARRCHGLAQAAAAPATYCVTFRLNEVYALVGLGAHADAVMLARELAQVAQPAHLQQRLVLLAQLFVLGAELAAGCAPATEPLQAALRRLRELQWPGVLTLLPQLLSRVWAEALERGIETDWVVASIRSRDLAPPSLCWPPSWPWAVRLSLLGPYACSCIGQGLPPSAAPGKVASRPHEMLRRLAVQGGYDGLAVEPLAAALWPGAGREGRAKVFDITLARLRKQLGSADALLLQDHRMRLNPKRVWLDRVALEQALLALADPALAAEARQDLWRQALALWRGPLLVGEPDADWLQAARQAIRTRLAAALLADAQTMGHHSRCLQALAADPALADLLEPAPTAPAPPRAARLGAR